MPAIMQTPPRSGTHKAVPIFGLGTPQRSPFLSTAHRLNAVVELTDNGRQQAAILGLPGLVAYLQLGSVPPRAVFVREGTLTFFLAVGNQIIVAAPNQPLVTVLTLTTDTGPVWMEDNGTQLFINDGVTAGVYTYSTGVFTPITDVDYPVGARGGTFLQGRFWVYVTTGPNAGRVYASDQYNGLSWDGLNFITPAARPTGIVAIGRWFNDLLIVGQKSLEWWSGTPTAILGALGFQPSANANTEIGGTAERGMASVNQRLFLLGHGEGTVGVYEIQGYSLVKISPPALDDKLANIPSTATAICTGYMATGHPMFQVTIPGQTKAGALTWVFDGLTNLWSERSSYNKPYYRGLLACHTLSTAYLTDAFTGTLYKLDERTYTEAGEPMEYEVTSVHLLKEGDSISVQKVQVDCETGHGDANAAEPQAVIQVSKDGGRNWGQERLVPMGKVGQYTRRAQARRFGVARDLAVKFRITEAIPRRVTGAYLIMEAGVS